MNTETLDGVKRSLNWLIVLGILMVVLGIAAIVEPFIATKIVARALSWTVLLAGIVRIFHTFQSQRQRGFWLKLLIGICYIFVGISLLSDIFGAKLTLTLAFGGVILAQGVFEVIAAFKIRPEPGWGWILFSGIVALIFGILILYGWPLNAIWLIGFFVGISFISTGIWMTMLPWTIRNHLSRT